MDHNKVKERNTLSTLVNKHKTSDEFKEVINKDCDNTKEVDLSTDTLLLSKSINNHKASNEFKQTLDRSKDCEDFDVIKSKIDSFSCSESFKKSLMKEQGVGTLDLSVDIKKLTNKINGYSTSDTFKKALSKTNDIWNGVSESKYRYNAIDVVGPVMNICRLSNADNVDEWVEYYFTQSSIKALSCDEFKNMTKQFALETNLSEDDAELQVFYRLFHETYMGLEKEKKLVNILRNCMKDTGATVNYASAKDDGKYAVDLEITLEEKHYLSIQVKPIKYLLGKNASLLEQQELNRKKNLKFKEHKSCNDVVYIYYTEDIFGNVKYLYNSDLLDELIVGKR